MARFAVVAAAALVALVVLGAAEGAPNGKYSDRYDHVDLDGLLKDPNHLGAVIKCFQSATDDDCNEMGKRVKAVLPEALPSDCERCTDRQKAGLTKVVGFLAKQKPEVWKALQAKYDPEDKFSKKHPELFH